jgi:23S rRNA pseudouridine2605 synthase
MPAGVFPIGRLDRATTGLLLFTSDGDLANAILHPDHHTDKVYWLWLDEVLSDSDPRLSRLCEGVDVGDERLSVASVIIQNKTSDFTELLVRLCEGKNRQIRRLCRALDFRLVALHRRSVGPIELGDLPIGAWRPLTAEEVESLWRATGGRERVRQRKIAALTEQALAAQSAGRPHTRLDEWLRAASRATSC